MNWAVETSCIWSFLSNLASVAFFLKGGLALLLTESIAALPALVDITNYLDVFEVDFRMEAFLDKSSLPYT